jgi:hypothetical protein
MLRCREHRDDLARLTRVRGALLASAGWHGHTRRVDEDFVQQTAVENAELREVVARVGQGLGGCDRERSLQGC